MRRVIGRLGTGAATLLAVIGAAASAQVARFERFTYQGRTQEQAPSSRQHFALHFGHLFPHVSLHLTIQLRQKECPEDFSGWCQ